MLSMKRRACVPSNTEPNKTVGRGLDFLPLVAKGQDSVSVRWTRNWQMLRLALSYSRKKEHACSSTP